MSDSWEDAVTDASQLAGGADSDGGRGHVHGSRVSGDRVDRGRVGGATGTASGYVSGHRIDGGGTPHNARGGGAGDGVGGGGTSHDAGGVGAEGFDGPTASVGASSSLVDGSNGDRRGDGTSDVRRRSGRVSPLPEGIDRMPAGVELARVCTEVDVASCNGYELEAVIAGLRRVIRWLEASCLTAVAELAHARGGGGPDADPGRLDEPDPDASALLEPLLCWTGHAAARYTAIALILTRYAPNTLTALRDGRIELAAARVIAERMLWLETDQLRHRLDQVIFPDAYTIPAVLPLRDYIEHQIITLDPEAAQRRRHHAINSRGFDLFPTTDGAANLRVRDIPAEHAAEAAAYVDAIARSMKATGDTRTLQQLKADIATALLSGTATITPCNGHTTHPNPDTDTASDVDRDVAQDPTRSANARLKASAHASTAAVSAQDPTGTRAVTGTLTHPPLRLPTAAHKPVLTGTLT